MGEYDTARSVVAKSTEVTKGTRVVPAGTMPTSASPTSVSKKNKKKVSFSLVDSLVDTYSDLEYERRNFDFYDSIRRRDRADGNWRRIAEHLVAVSTSQTKSS